MTTLRDLSRRPQAHVGVVLAAGLLAYANGFGAPFTFDDRRCIVDNPAIRSFDFFAAPSKAASLPASLQCAFASRFLTHLTFAVNYRLGGLAVTGYHVFNVAVQLSNSLLVYLLVFLAFQSPLLRRRQDGAGAQREAGPFVALFSALLFVVHPIQTQAVTYVTQRFTSLATFFYLLAAVLYLGHRLSASPARSVLFHAGALVSAALAMVTKEISFTLPLTLVLLEAVLFRDGIGRRFVRLAPFFVLMLVPLALLGAFARSSLGELDTSLRSLGRSPLTRWEYLLTQLRVVVTYLRLFVLPVGQSVDHDYPVYRSILDPPVLLSLLFLLALVGAAALLLVRSRGPGGRPELALVSMGLLWFFVTLTVESGAVPLADVIFEHRMYLPSVGLCLAASTAALLARDRLERTGPAAAVVAPALSAVVLVLAVATHLRNELWADEIRLWEEAAAKGPRKVRPHMELGALHAAGNRLSDAAREIELAIALAPDHAEARNSLGVILRRQGRFEAAAASYREALRLRPDFAEARANLGLLWVAQGRPEEAVREFEEAVRLRPDYADAHNGLGVLYARQGRLEEAVREWRAALAINPAHARARANLEQALGRPVH